MNEAQESRRKLIVGTGIAVGAASLVSPPGMANPVPSDTWISVSDYGELAELDASQLTEGMKITVRDKGIGGDFIVKTITGSIVSDNGTVLLFPKTSQFYAERAYSGPVNVLWFNEPNDQKKIKKAIDTHSDVYLPEGVYQINKPIEIGITEGKTIRGAGQNSTIIKNLNTTGEDAIQLIGNSSVPGTRVAYVEISNMTIEGNPSSGHGIYTDLAYENTFKRLRIINHSNPLKNGIHIQRGFYSEIVRVTVQGCGKDGIHLGETANANIVTHCHFGGSPEEGNGRAGLYIGSNGVTSGRTHGCQVTGNVFESNKQFNVLIIDADTNLISGNYLEGASSDNMTSQLTITAADGLYCDANIVRDNDFTGAVLSIQINNAHDTLITGNDINYGITLFGGAVGTKIVHNTNIDTSNTAQISDGGSRTTFFHSQRFQLPDLPNTRPSPGHSQLWFDPLDGYRVKYEP